MMDIKFVTKCMASGLEKTSGAFGDFMLGTGMSSYKPPSGATPRPTPAPVAAPVATPKTDDVTRPSFNGKTMGSPDGGHTNNPNAREALEGT